MEAHREPKSWTSSPGFIASVCLLVFALWTGYLGYELLQQVKVRYEFKLAAFPSVAVLVTNFSASALVPALALCAYFLRERSSENDSGMRGIFHNILAIIVGGAIGWGLGVFLVPYDDLDGAIYSKIGAGVTAFLSGFVVSHIPRLVESQLAKRSEAFLVQTGLGGAALLIAGVSIITNRTEYLEFARYERAAQQAMEANEKAEIEAVKARYASAYAKLKQERLMQQGEGATGAFKRLYPHP